MDMEKKRNGKSPLRLSDHDSMIAVSDLYFFVALHIDNKDRCAAHLNMHGHRRVIHHAGARYIGHVHRQLLVLAALLLDEGDDLIHLLILRADHQSGVPLAQEASRCGQAGHTIVVLGELAHHIVLIVISHNCINHLHKQNLLATLRRPS